jgi:hypothetical protein
MATVICHTEGCSNSGQPIELNVTYVDDETGETRTVDAVGCGVCGQAITDVTE